MFNFTQFCTTSRNFTTLHTIVHKQYKQLYTTLHNSTNYTQLYTTLTQLYTIYSNSEKLYTTLQNSSQVFKTSQNFTTLYKTIITAQDFTKLYTLYKTAQDFTHLLHNFTHTKTLLNVYNSKQQNCTKT